MFIWLNFQSHASAWPFLKPVEKSEAPDYYDHIKFPMGKGLCRTTSDINSLLRQELRLTDPTLYPVGSDIH
jgi:hypothetical protein